MKDESKTKVDLIKNLKTMRKEQEKSTVNNITERKQAEGKLQDSEEYLKILFDYAPDAYYVNDLKGNFTDGNKAAERLTGYKREELIGENFLKLKLFSPIDILKITKLLVKSFEGQPTRPDKFILNRKDNSKVTVEISTYPIKIKGRTLVLGMVSDITQRKKAIKEIEELAKFPAENPNPVLRITKDGTVLYHNYPSEPLLEHWHYQKGKALQDRWIQLVIDALHDNAIKTVETEIGDKVIFLTFAPIAEKGFVNVYGSDITELKQSEERIKHLNLVLRAIRNINQLIFKENDRERLIKGVCNGLTETRGYYSSFIVLLDEKGKIDTYAESGLGEDFLLMLKRLKKGELTTFGQIALKQEEVVIIKDPASTCPDCPLVQVCSARGSVMTVRLGRDGKIYGVMSVSIPTHFITDKEEQDLFMEAAGDVVLGLHSIEMGQKLDKQTHDLKERVKELKRAMDATIETMSKIIETKDPYTAGHQQKVSQLATAIAKELNLSQDKVEGIRIASLIHDIGKIGLPTEILSKPIKSSDIEFSLIKEHPQIGYNILQSIDFSYPVAQIILQHHERLNGLGYPNHLKGDQIFLEARIIGVADVVEAMSSHRPYRPALGIDKALEEISQNRGILYDPEVVDACLKLFKEKGFKFE